MNNTIKKNFKMLMTLLAMVAIMAIANVSCAESVSKGGKKVAPYFNANGVTYYCLDKMATPPTEKVEYSAPQSYSNSGLNKVFINLSEGKGSAQAAVFAVWAVMDGADYSGEAAALGVADGYRALLQEVDESAYTVGMTIMTTSKSGYQRLVSGWATKNPEPTTEAPTTEEPTTETPTTEVPTTEEPTTEQPTTETPTTEVTTTEVTTTEVTTTEVTTTEVTTTEVTTTEQPTTETTTEKPTVEVTSKKVTKVWDVPEGTTIPESIQVQLYADGVAVGNVVELSALNDWTYTWTTLVKFDGEKEIVYTVDEINVPSGYIKSIEDNGSDVTITNTLPSPKDDSSIEVAEETDSSIPQSTPEPKSDGTPMSLVEEDTTTIPQTGQTVIWLSAIAVLALLGWRKLRN